MKVIRSNPEHCLFPFDLFLFSWKNMSIDRFSDIWYININEQCMFNLIYK